jgi:acetolactate synthase regulatory subunit
VAASLTEASKVDVVFAIVADRPDPRVLERILATLRRHGVAILQLEAEPVGDRWSVGIRGRCPEGRLDLVRARLQGTVGVVHCATARAGGLYLGVREEARSMP